MICPKMIKIVHSAAYMCLKYNLSLRGGANEKEDLNRASARAL